MHYYSKKSLAHLHIVSVWEGHTRRRGGVVPGGHIKTY